MKERIRQKIGRVNEYLRLIRELEPDCREKFQSDPQLSDVEEFLRQIKKVL
nr:hypothetical protein [Desulfobulbaceae bacterium]